MKLLLIIKPGGDVEAIYHDFLLKLKLGKANIHRISNVAFNADRQRWEATEGQGNLIAHGETRADCVEREHDFMTQRLAYKYRYRLTGGPKRKKLKHAIKSRV